MNRLLSTLGSIVLAGALSVGLTSCDNEPDAGGYVVKFTSLNQDWSSQEYKNVKIARISTDIADLKIESTSNYNLRLEPSGHTDDEGYPVYWIVTNLPSIGTTTTDNRVEVVSIPVTLSGTKNLTGESILFPTTQTISFTRYYEPTPTREELAKDWWLAAMETTSYNDWETMVGDSQAYGYLVRTLNYDLGDSPLRFDTSTVAGTTVLSYTNNGGELPGWTAGAQNMEVSTQLINGQWVTGRDEHVAVYYVGEKELRCMTAVYGSDGYVENVYRYRLRP